GGKKRPAVVGDWLKRHRDYAKPPVIKNVPQFADAGRDWWSSMQPAWRIDGADWPLKRAVPSGETWSEVTKGGPNGIVLVLIALVWWA
ncbi:hypothetical protein BV25DRAFT_1786644, partial [Artomyces pyxidatus]